MLPGCSCVALFFPLQFAVVWPLPSRRHCQALASIGFVRCIASSPYLLTSMSSAFMPSFQASLKRRRVRPSSLLPEANSLYRKRTAVNTFTTLPVAVSFTVDCSPGSRGCCTYSDSIGGVCVSQLLSVLAAFLVVFNENLFVGVFSDTV